ncbi:MAG: hypothetical protein IPN96_04105 [Anaerolineales bacterium]|nr:hypothetical protein [Anaerolineales bacterium]MBK8823799.1 hypothetical protein [Anaerolineales bacterium]
MKKLFVLTMVLGLTLSACLPAAPQETATVAPVSIVDLEATAAIFVEQTLQSLPTSTPIPSNTPVMVTATQTVTQTATTAPTTPVETQNPILLTLTATLGTGTPATNAPGTLQPSATSTVNANPAFSATVTETPHLQYYGTMPPYLAYSKITLNNKSKSEVYISLQCTTSEGYKTIIEYPVNGQIKANAPVGKYVYVAWVGGRKIIGKFTLSNDHDLIINIFKDHLEIK